MKLKRPVVLSIIAIVVVWSGLTYATINAIDFFREAGMIHYSFNRVERFHSKNIEHYEKVANYMFDDILYFYNPFFSSKTGDVFAIGDVKQWKTILKRQSGEYFVRVYDAEKSNAASYFLGEEDLNELPANLTKSLDKLYNGCVGYVGVDQTRKKSTYIEFVQEGGNLFDRQIIVYFPDDNHDLDFFFGYKITPLAQKTGIILL